MKINAKFGISIQMLSKKLCHILLKQKVFVLLTYN